VREVTNIARRIAGILLMERELDAGYREVKTGREARATEHAANTGPPGPT
jgi:hypothetical protein